MKKNFGDQNSGESRQLATNRLKEKLIWKMFNNRTNLINSTSGSITCLSLFPSRRSETRHECVNLLQQSKVLKTWAENVHFGALALCVVRDEVSSLFTFFCVICHEVSSPSRFLVFGDWMFFYGDHFAIKGRQKATFWKCELGALGTCKRQQRSKKLKSLNNNKRQAYSRAWNNEKKNNTRQITTL